MLVVYQKQKDNTTVHTSIFAYLLQVISSSQYSTTLSHIAHFPSADILICSSPTVVHLLQFRIIPGSLFWIQMLFKAFLSLAGLFETYEIHSKTANPTFWSSWLAQLHQARSIEHRKMIWIQNRYDYICEAHVCSGMRAHCLCTGSMEM